MFPHLDTRCTYDLPVPQSYPFPCAKPGIVRLYRQFCGYSILVIMGIAGIETHPAWERVAVPGYLSTLVTVYGLARLPDAPL